MRILFALDNYDNGTGGAEICAQVLARALVSRGHRVEVLQIDETQRSYRDDDVEIHTRVLTRPRVIREGHRDALRANSRWREMLDGWLAGNRPDLVITQQKLLYGTVDAALARGIPVVGFVHAFGMFCPRQFRDRDPLRDCNLHCRACFPMRRRLLQGTTERSLESQRDGLRRASLVIANSRYVQTLLRQLLSIESSLVYPCTDLDRYRSEGGDHDRVLFVKPQYVKGLPIASEIARRMPDTRFIVLGKPHRRGRRALASLPNVELAGWTDDMRPVYARSRVVLGPSIWPEPFGRVFVEAAACGVPSVASNRGGIPESVGDGGLLVSDIFDIDAWIEALRQLEDPVTWQGLSEKARAHAEQFGAASSVAAFVGSVRTSIGLEL
jgi:glycosyltransferase involved in cell wall biosynthesis